MNDSAAREVVERTLRALEEAWNRADGAMWAARCAPDIRFINRIGNYVQGRAPVTEMHEKIWHGRFANSRVKFQIEHVRVLSGDAILAIASAELKIPAGPAEGVIKSIATLLLVRDGDEWLVESFQNTTRESA
jgi:uncharacterized protein (TIGR02246 family)